MSAAKFLEFRECQGCGELFPVRSRYAYRAKWCSDRCRKRQYASTCIDCGAPVNANGSAGTRSPERCIACRADHDAYWKRERIIERIQRWVMETGEVPAAGDWRIARGRDVPPTAHVQSRFGSWNEAIRAAGFTPRPVGCYGRQGEDIDLCREIRSRYEAGESTPTLALVYGVAENTISYRIQKAGGTLRTRAEAAAVRYREAA